MTATVTIDPAGNEAQAAYVADEARESMYFGGVGSGKTTGGIMRLARHIFEWNPGERLAIVTPTVPMMRSVVLPELKKWGLYTPDIEVKGENRLEYPNGTTVLLESANNRRKVERLRGLNLAGVWLDEIGEHYQKTYEILGDRLRTGQYRNLWGTGTPVGKNWVYRETVRPLLSSDGGPAEGVSMESVAGGELLSDGERTIIKGVSTRTNPHTPEDYKAAREEQYSGHALQQEVHGRFVSPEGLVYDWFSRAEHVTEDRPDEYDRTFYGVDWGYNSPAAVVAILETDGPDGSEFCVADEIYSRGSTVSELAESISELVDRFGTGPVYCDPAEPASVETLQHHGLPAEAAQNDVLPGIQYVTELRSRLSFSASCRNLQNEIQGYEWRDEDTEKPVKANDHLLDALRYALFSDRNATDSFMVL